MQDHNSKAKIITNSDEETIDAGEKFAMTLQAGDIVCLYGDLGAGKTTITKGVARGLGVKDRIISPTFSLVRQHEIDNKLIKTFYHLDLYRLENEDEIKSIGIEEILSDPQGVVLIEWAEKMNNLLPKKRREIRIENIDENRREITIFN